MVDDTLQRWCDTSLKLVRCCPPVNNPEEFPVELNVEEEWAIEAAAFMKLASSLGIAEAQAITMLGRTGESNGCLKPLIRTCPLDQTSPIESLGSIHEYFVTRRDDSAANSFRGNSKRRKVGGVFYTPRQVVEYIVGQTVGPRLDRFTPDRTSELKIVDPAAGCGAFLLTTFRVLMKWYLNWYTNHSPECWTSDVVMTERGWRLTWQRCQLILASHLFGVDVDGAAIETARRTLWLAQFEFTESTQDSISTCHVQDPFRSNFHQGNSLVGSTFGDVTSSTDFSAGKTWFVWAEVFPDIARRGGFDVVIGNPPYRREKNFKSELDEIRVTPLGRYHSPRMDLWYYFVHRGIQLLRSGGTLSYITNSYWTSGTGADKLIAALRDEVHLNELFLLRNQPVFPGVSGQHSIFRLTKMGNDSSTRIKIALRDTELPLEILFTDESAIRTFTKTREQLFQKKRLNIWPPLDNFLERMNGFPRLNDLGVVRQGIAENPATINRRTLERFRGDPASKDWRLEEGVFSLRSSEVSQLTLNSREALLLRPYHDLCDLGRYWLATRPSRNLIYSTRTTCPEIADYPTLEKHLSRFRVILDSRRETRSGSNRWWHLHWPRDENLWRAKKLIALQMASRPSFVPATEPTYVSFSANVFVSAKETREDLRYVCGLLNSRVLWGWFIHHAKLRGIGLELNGHVLEQTPIRRIDFEDPFEVAQHDQMVELVDRRLSLERSRVERSTEMSLEMTNEIPLVESRIDALACSLFRLDAADVELVNALCAEQLN